MEDGGWRGDEWNKDVAHASDAEDLGGLSPKAGEL